MLRLARVRLAALLVAMVLDAAFFLYPRETIGVDYLSPANALLAAFWCAVSFGVVLVLQAGWDSRAFRVLLVCLDPLIVLSLFLVIFHSLQGSEKIMHPVVVTAATLTLLAVTGALGLTANAAALSGVVSVACFAMVALMVGYSLAEAIFVCGIIGAAGWLGMRLAENTRRAVQAEAHRVILRRMLPPHLADGDPAAALALVMDAREVDATILVSDLREFTASVEKSEPRAALAFLNDVQGRLADCVRGHGGTVDKFIGDGMLAVFGALDPLANHAGAALAAAAEIRNALRVLNLQRRVDAPPLRVGVGIHSGRVVAGCVGSGERLEFTVIGDAVNTASRLEAATKEYDVDILVSETTRALSGSNPDRLVFVGHLALRGRESRLPAYRLADLSPSAASGARLSAA